MTLLTTAAAAASPSLPAFVEPMLCATGEAFDSDEHLFEIKWDGTRGLAFVGDGGLAGVRLVNRRRVDITPRYPELAEALAALPPGTVLDGEVVVLGPDGKPDFSALQSREHTRSPRRWAYASKSHPATMIVFDQLYRRYQPLLDQPCRDRRAILRETIAAGQRVLVSEGVTGDGIAYFAEACRQELEGVVAKRLSSPYLPGKRTDAWVKVKRQQVYCCVVIGFVPTDDRRRDFSALVIAAEVDGGVLACVGKVGSGFDEATRAQVNTYLWSHLRDAGAPPVAVAASTARGSRWVEPALFCRVRCMERTAAGHLRAPAFLGIIGGGA